MMNKADSIEEKFNKMADEGGAGPSDADNENRKRRARNRVVDYVDADSVPGLKEDMERCMEPVDRAPDSFEAIITYGHPPLEQLGKIANDMIRVQGKFNDQVNVMAGAMQKLENGMNNMNMGQFAEATKNMLKGLAEGTTKGAKGLGKGISGFWKSLTGSNKKATEDEKLIQQMQDQLPQMLFEMIKLVDDIAKTEAGIKQVMMEAEKLGLARVEATREINVYLGASKEVLRRFNEEYIPDAEKNFEESQDPEDELYLKDVLKRKEQFIGRITVLEGSRLQSINAAQQLKHMMDVMEDQRAKIQDILFNGQNEWKAMLAEAGIAGSSLKAAQAIQKADQFGDKMHDETMKMIEEAHEMTQNSKSRGTIDPVKLIEASGRLQKLIEKENDNNRKRLEDLEATSRNLRGAADKLLESVDSANKQRLLEAVKDAKEDAAAAKAEVEDVKKPVNDNKTPAEQQPEATAKDAPAAEGRRVKRGPKL